MREGRLSWRPLFVFAIGSGRRVGAISLMSVGFDPPMLAALRNFDATQCTEPEREAVVRLALRTVVSSGRWRREQTRPGHPTGRAVGHVTDDDELNLDLLNQTPGAKEAVAQHKKVFELSHGKA